MTETTLPCNIKADDADVALAKGILKDNKNYSVRYIRHNASVALGLKPARNSDGAIIPTAPYTKHRVVCSGVPYGCMIAFLHDKDLYIGWSKRYEARSLIETQELRDLFNVIINSDLPKDADDHRLKFEAFCARLVKFLSCQQPKETEISFSKSAGKVAAIIRGLKDSIIVKGNYFASQASGPIPGDIAKNLAWFISHVEETYGTKATNVSYSDSLPAKPADTAVVVG